MVIRIFDPKKPDGEHHGGAGLTASTSSSKDLK
jgi:hypothetical protein